jgi:predicted RNA binding protein YcfA (HicA-like mRNA interferase family)
MSKQLLSVHTATPRDLINLAREQGYEILPGRGKGSHVVMGKPGCPTITIPGGKHVGRNVVRRMLKVIMAQATAQAA